MAARQHASSYTALGLFAGLVVLVAAAPVSALPPFARQTGQQCAACHVGGNWPQLTPWGRWFKLTGYTAGRDLWSKETVVDHLPLGTFGQAGVTWASEPKDAVGSTVVPDNGNVASTR